jgi:hypothetical protein
MKRRSLSLVGVCVAIIVLAYGAWMGVKCRHFCRGGWDWIFYALFAGQDTTEFAPQFDEAKFSRIVKGMDRNQVLGVLGEPLAKYPEGNCDETWHYSSPTLKKSEPRGTYPHGRSQERQALERFGERF